MAWEVDWAHPENNGSRVMARNPSGHLPSSREWHLVFTGYLRAAGVNTPTFRTDSWEVDWGKREGKRVWARNPKSKMPSAREWHWIDFHTLNRAGIAWRPKTPKTGRYMDRNGYVNLSRRAMSTDEVLLAERCGLFRGSKKGFVREHHLVVVKKYGRMPAGSVVRHLNGIKSDNRPENLVLGTTQENTMDHNTARLQAMYWRNKYEELAKEVGREPEAEAA